MNPISDEVPDELRDAWGKLLEGGDERKLRRHLPALQRTLELVRGVEASFQAAFEGIRPEAVDPAKRSEARTALVTSLQSHSLSIGGVLGVFSRLSADGQGAVQSVLDWIANHLVKILTAFASHLGLQNWSISGQIATFPPGATFTITLTFA
jgi:hypothetical protein